LGIEGNGGCAGTIAVRTMIGMAELVEQRLISIARRSA
jgi:hypothetical protein